MKLAVVGAGWAGEAHVAAISQISGSSVEYICSRRPSAAENLARRYGVEHWTTDLEEVLSCADVEAVTIATPPSSHFVSALAALRRGKHVYCEKPLALNLAQARTLEREARRHGTKAHVAFIHRFDPVIRTIRDTIQAGDLGAIEHLAVTNFMWLPANAVSKSWMVSREEGGGPLLNLGSHDIDRAMYLLDDVLTVTAGVYTARSRLQAVWDAEKGAPAKRRVTTEDGYSAICLARGGTVVVARGGTSTRTIPGRSLEIYGTNGTILYDDHIARVCRGANTRFELLAPREERGLFDRLPDYWQQSLEEFIHINTTATTGANACFNQALTVQAVLEAIQVSAQTRSWARTSRAASSRYHMPPGSS